MLTTAVAMSAASVAAFLITLSRVVGWQRILRYSTLIDVTFTILLGVIFYGTLTGMLVAVLGGLFMALTLTALKRLMAVGSAVSKPSKVIRVPAGADAAEYNENGWVYNQAPYA